MPHADFVHLRVHSAYSLSEGAVRIEDLVSLCKRSRMPAVAVTDSGNLFGAMEFAVYASQAGVQPIVGTLLAVGDTPRRHTRHDDEPAPILLLAQNETGYRNLLELVSCLLSGNPRNGSAACGVEPTRGPHGRPDCAERRPRAGPVGRALAEGRTEACAPIAGAPGRAVSGTPLCRIDAPRRQRTLAGRGGVDRTRLCAGPAPGGDQRRSFRCRGRLRSP